MRDKGWWKGFLVLCCAALLSACSPDYNWRQVSVADGRLMAMFPAKPASEQRNLDFEGRQLAFSMTQARVGDDVFAVGYAPWGDAFRDEPDLRERVAREVLLSLYRNFGAPPPETLPAMGAPFELRAGQDESVLLRARIWLTSHGLVEGMVVTAGAPADEQALVFFDALAKSVGGASP